MNLPFLHRLQALATPTTTVAVAASRQHAQAAAMVEEIRAELPELLAVAVIDMERGQALATHSTVPGLTLSKAVAQEMEVVRLKQRAIQALRLIDEQIEDILVTMREQLHLLRLSRDGQRLLYLVVSTQDTNLAIAREVLRVHAA